MSGGSLRPMHCELLFSSTSAASLVVLFRPTANLLSRFQTPWILWGRCFGLDWTQWWVLCTEVSECVRHPSFWAEKKCVQMYSRKEEARPGHRFNLPERTACRRRRSRISGPRSSRRKSGRMSRSSSRPVGCQYNELPEMTRRIRTHRFPRVDKRVLLRGLALGEGQAGNQAKQEEKHKLDRKLHDAVGLLK